MQIEAEILTASMMTAFFGYGVYETASDREKDLCQTVVMGAYLAACESQHLKDEADERARACEALQVEIDYIRSILVEVRKNPVNSSSVNLMIASLPCEREIGERAMGLSYTSHAGHASDFVTRLLDKRDIGHFHYTFNSLRANPYVNGPDAMILLMVGLEMHALKLTLRQSNL